MDGVCIPSTLDPAVTAEPLPSSLVCVRHRQLARPARRTASSFNVTSLAPPPPPLSGPRAAPRRSPTPATYPCTSVAGTAAVVLPST